MELLTAARMRAIEQAAIASGEVTGLELMERAGRGVVEAVFAEWPELARTAHRALVLCGPGNNGGDGFVVARLLHARGWEVALYLYGDQARLPPDARTNCERWVRLGQTGGLLDMPADAVAAAPPALIVDALFGTGLTRPLRDDLIPVLREIERLRRRDPVPARCVAVDIPSGLCSDSGRSLGAACSCDLTVTFHTAKPGHYLADGPARCGKVAIADIGLPRPSPAASEGGDIIRLTAPSPGLGKAGGHKYAHGHALILSGGPGRGGAGRLAARGALRIGAGLVTVGCPPAALQENAARLDAIMLAPIGGVERLHEEIAARKVNAICLGPGLGIERARELVPAVLAAAPAVRHECAPYGGGEDGRGVARGVRPEGAPYGRSEDRLVADRDDPGRVRIHGAPSTRPISVVLDADALTAFRDDPAALFDLLHEGCVLTPHMGEFGRLFPDIRDRLDAPAAKGPAFSRVDAAREAAARAGCVVLLKGADTVIAAPDGSCAINAACYERAAPWLATAGAGDVLAGFITGLLARGFSPMQAAGTGAWLHVGCARYFGPGLIAEDLPEALPAVLRDPGLRAAQGCSRTTPSFSP